MSLSPSVPYARFKAVVDSRQRLEALIAELRAERAQAEAEAVRRHETQAVRIAHLEARTDEAEARGLNLAIEVRDLRRRLWTERAAYAAGIGVPTEVLNFIPMEAVNSPQDAQRLVADLLRRAPHLHC